MGIKDRIKELCRMKNVTAKDVEQELGFAPGFISKIDKASPTAANISKIAKYFGVSVDWLIGLYKPEEKKSQYYTDPATSEMMQKLFESPGRRALFKAVENMDEESVQKYADFIERITNDNNKGN